MVSGLTFKSLIHFELIFVSDVFKYSSLFLLVLSLKKIEMFSLEKTMYIIGPKLDQIKCERAELVSKNYRKADLIKYETSSSRKLYK